VSAVKTPAGTLAADAQKILRELGADPKKRFGQNFMISESALSAIAGALTVDPGVPVLEIGPGLGFLTRYLIERGYRVTTVEKDRVFARSLEKRLNHAALRVVERDILSVDPKTLGFDGSFAVAGNIPYNITTPILEWLIGHRSVVREAVLTVQKEVAARLAAKPGTKAWGSLTVFVRTFADVTPVCQIPRSAFLPPPNVDSAAIRLEFLKAPREDVGSQETYFFLVRHAFQKRRKTLANALEDPSRPALEKHALTAALGALGIDPRRRPETLQLSEWAALSRRLSGTGLA
jgi:16S rRNA (adenine1518-N6/adenine1519-N6)-dimethyltransferase